MYHIDKLHKEICDIYGQYKQFNIFLDFKEKLEENESYKIITWQKYCSGIKKSSYSQIFSDLTSNRQYTFLLKDNSFIQLYYKFEIKTNNLNIAKLAYYPVPNHIYLDDEEYLKNLSETFSENEIWEMIGEKDYSITNTSHIRIDYDANVRTHDKCEIQVGGIKELRIPVDTLISPLHFFEFIMRCKSIRNNSFNEIYTKIRNQRDFNTKFAISKKQCLTIENCNKNNIYITFPLE